MPRASFNLQRSHERYPGDRSESSTVRVTAFYRSVEITYSRPLRASRVWRGHVCDFDRVLFGGGSACTICDRVAPPEPEPTGPTIDLDRHRSVRWERPGMPHE